MEDLKAIPGTGIERVFNESFFDDDEANGVGIPIHPHPNPPNPFDNNLMNDRGHETQAYTSPMIGAKQLPSNKS